MEIIPLSIGLALATAGMFLKLRKPHYQKERTTSGHIIRFLEYDESKRHVRIKTTGIVLILAGMMVFLLGLYLALFADK